jgi:hypothetical protein
MAQGSVWCEDAKFPLATWVEGSVSSRLVIGILLALIGVGTWKGIATYRESLKLASERKMIERLFALLEIEIDPPIFVDRFKMKNKGDYGWSVTTKQGLRFWAEVYPQGGAFKMYKSGGDLADETPPSKSEAKARAAFERMVPLDRKTGEKLKVEAAVGGTFCHLPAWSVNFEAAEQHYTGDYCVQHDRFEMFRVPSLDGLEQRRKRLGIR